MNNSSKPLDFWRVPVFFLWVVFFVAGLFPEPAFAILRQLGDVLPQRALVNSPHLITVMLAAYVAVFAWHRCVEAGLSALEAQDKAFQLGIVALVAFLAPVDPLIMYVARGNPFAQNRILIYGVGAIKLLAWWSLLIVFIRYYVFNVDDAFAEVVQVVPRTWRAKKKTAPLAPAETANPSTGNPSPAEDPEQDRSGKAPGSDLSSHDQ